ncbi:DUF2141 domain-containing protein [Allosphingosinicella vermicomposti]|uniref:DUF2141 domain-containing protein n=1 Tax=Allosphingosinicella vermicomposti TaxID=614671 RepID=UPI001FDF7801|nr:DUF2141 domain-containing protein [Allosphingosinicella vermicomposti]
MGISLLILAVPSAATVAGEGGLTVHIDNLRNAKGVVHLCLTRDPARFPDCKGDPQALTTSFAAGPNKVAHFDRLAPGTYAIAAIHDENGNGKLDTLALVPREGFGFSKNPAIRFGPPKFREAQFVIGAGTQEQRIKIRYLL